MAVARALYTDLQLNFALGANTLPNTTQVPKIIIQYYKDAYAAAYGPGTYATYDAADEDPVIDTEECKSIIIAEVQVGINKWVESLRPGSQKDAPKLRLSQDGANEIAVLVGPRMRFASREDDDLEETGDNIL